METEIEAKWLDIDVDAMRAKLKAAGAKRKAPERLMVRKNFDYEDKRLEKIGGWIRVRNEGDKVTMSYKQLYDRTLHGTKEVSLTVNDFDSACNFLEVIGLPANNYQETKRESWELDGGDIELDTWPWIPTFMEIEAKDEAGLRAVAEKLGLDFAKAMHGSVETAYQDKYDVTEEEIDNWPQIRFIPVPDWLEAKRKKA